MMFNEYIALKLHNVRTTELKGTDSTNRALNEIISEFKSELSRRNRKERRG